MQDNTYKAAWSVMYDAKQQSTRQLIGHRNDTETLTTLTEYVQQKMRLLLKELIISQFIKP